MNVAVLSREQWQSLLPVADSDRGRLTALLAAVHGQHGGLTVASAKSWLSGGAAGLQARIRARLNQSLMSVRGDGITARAGTSELRATFLELVPPSLLVLQVLVPLSREACTAIGRTVLFGEISSPEAAQAARDYDAYSEAFDKALERTIGPPREAADDESADRRRMFWDRTAFLLLSAAEVAADSLADAPSPSVDGGVLHLIKTLEPKFSGRTRSAAQRLRNTQTTSRKVPLKQGGIKGIRQTRSLQDLSDRLVSELVQPSVLQLERVLNSGFLVHHRPPPMDNRRNLLLVGLTLTPSDGSGSAFAKAVWLDAAERLAVLLVRAGLERSDLVHITRFDDHAVARVAVAVETHHEERRALDAFGFGARERLAIMRTHGWLPGLLAALPNAIAPAKRRPDEDEDGNDPVFMRDLEQTLLTVFRGFPESAGTCADRGQVFESYARIHFQIFLPDTLGSQLETSRLRFDRLCRRVGLANTMARNLTVIVVPDAATSSFRILQAHRSASTIRGTDDAIERDLNTVAADLSGALITAALETVDA